MIPLPKALVTLILLLSLQQLSHAHDTRDPLQKFSDSLLGLACNGQIPVFDSSGKNIPIEPFYYRFTFDANNIGFWDGSSCIMGLRYEDYSNPVPHHSFILRYGFLPESFITDIGISHEGSYFLNDTSEHPDYYVFYDEKTKLGELGPIKFYIHKGLDRINLHDTVINIIAKHYTDNPASKNIYNMIVSKRKNWRNNKILYKGSEVHSDTCQRLYYLDLNDQHEFKQGFKQGKLEKLYEWPGAITPKFTTGIQFMYMYLIRVEKGNHKVRPRYCECFVETNKGIWQVKNNELILYTYAGVEMVRYKILKAGASTLELETGDVKVTLEKR